MAKSKYEYIAEYRQRIQEVEYNQKDYGSYDSRSSYELKRQCQMELARLSSVLMDMYDTMPIVNEIVIRKSIINGLQIYTTVGKGYTGIYRDIQGYTVHPCRQ